MQLLKRQGGFAPQKPVRLQILHDINQEFYGSTMIYSRFVEELGIPLSRLNNWLYRGYSPDYPLLKQFIKAKRLELKVAHLQECLAVADGI